jgi:hypothetical protein
MDERLRFVARLLEGEKMAPLCAEFGISRKTGYKIYDRYKDCGIGAFTDRSRRARVYDHSPVRTEDAENAFGCSPSGAGDDRNPAYQSADGRAIVVSVNSSAVTLFVLGTVNTEITEPRLEQEQTALRDLILIEHAHVLTRPARPACGRRSVSSAG